MNKLHIGFTPCPNDIFMFDALINKKIDTQGLDVSYEMHDIEKLNTLAAKKHFDICKVSFHAFLYLTNDFLLMDSGNALGNNCGPLLISKHPYTIDECANLSIAIPGQYTTANFLLDLAIPLIKQKKEYIFSNIEDAIINKEVDAGVIIHESRFTYEKKGLIKILDLGEYWHNQTNSPIPLGGIIANRAIPQDTLLQFNSILKKSIEYAFLHPTSGLSFIKDHAQIKEDTVIDQHIRLYVTNYSLDLNNEAKKAIVTFFEKAIQLKHIYSYNKMLFLQS